MKVFAIATLHTSVLPIRTLPLCIASRLSKASIKYKVKNQGQFHIILNLIDNVQRLNKVTYRMQYLGLVKLLQSLQIEVYHPF